MIDCRAISDKMRSELKAMIDNSVTDEANRPTLAIFTDNADPVQRRYTNSRVNACKAVGINVIVVTPDDGDSVIKYDWEPRYNGIIIDEPISDRFKHINSDYIADYKDVDCASSISDVLLDDNPKFYPCTAMAAMRIIDECYPNGIEGLDVTVVNRSKHLGLPLVAMLTKRNATVTVCHSKSKLYTHISNITDILITAMGNPHYFDKSMFKSYDPVIGDFYDSPSTIIDIGTSFKDGVMCGDCHPNMHDVADLTPVPNGVGLLTTTMLMYNTYKAWCLQNGVEYNGYQI